MTLVALLPLALMLGLGLMLSAELMRRRDVTRQRRSALLTRYATAARVTPGTLKIETPAEVRLRTDRRRRRAAKAWHPRNLIQTIGVELGRVRASVTHLTAVESGLLALCFGVLFGALAFGTGLPLLLSAASALLLTALVLAITLKRRRQKRLQTIAEAVPDTLESIVRSLRIGAPIPKALKMVADSMEGPIAEEFTRTSQAISYGHDLLGALNELAERTENQDLRFFSTVVAIQYNSGGNLAEVLSRLSEICRGRQRLKRKVDVITSEAKWSGNFLSAFPIVAAVGIWTVNPGYFDEIYQTPLFTPLMIAIAILLVANLIFMRRMTNFSD